MTAVNVAGLLGEPAGATRALRLRDHYLTLGPDVELAGPIDADLRLQRTNRGILVRGDVRAPLRRTCGRCLDAFVDEVGVEVSEEFLPSVDPESGALLDQPAGDEQALTIDEHHEIELDPVLRDELLLTEPMLPLCRDTCRGLCPECGERLEEGDHAHAAADVDPRLASLAALLRDRDGEGGE